MSGTTLSEATRARIVELAASGMTRNRIAAELGVSAGSVTRYVRAAGGSFDRTTTAAATEAAARDDAARRQQFAAALLGDLQRDTIALRSMKPKDIREAEQLFRARAAAARAFADISRAAPPRGDDVNTEVRAALVGFREGLRGLFEDDDTYGQVSDDAPSPSDGDQIGQPS